MKKDILSLNYEQLAAELEKMGEPKFRCGQLFSWLHKKQAASFETMLNLPASLRGRLAESFYIAAPAVVLRLRSKKDATEKYLLEFADGERVEAVFMEYRHGNTLCISTQVGCRMGCVFCASAIGGLVRSLTAGELLGEVYTLVRECGRPVGGIVLMGIGEPLDNFDNVLAFLETLSSPEGMNMSLRHVSLSTCGLVPQIDRLAKRALPLTLSVSLHAPDDETRSAIMPINRKYGVDMLLESTKRYFAATGRRVSFEYALIAGKNDTPEHAKRLCERLRGQNCHVNLIPVNEVSGRENRRGSREAVEKFLVLLKKGGINATVRRELGGDINAACGQLRRESAGKEEVGLCCTSQAEPTRAL